jgi:hypothetical protein
MKLFNQKILSLILAFTITFPTALFAQQSDPYSDHKQNIEKAMSLSFNDDEKFGLQMLTLSFGVDFIGAVILWMINNDSPYNKTAQLNGKIYGNGGTWIFNEKAYYDNRQKTEGLWPSYPYNDRRPLMEFKIDSKSLNEPIPMGSLAEIEILDSNPRLQDYLEIRNGAPTPESRLILNRFPKLNQLLQTMEMFGTRFHFGVDGHFTGSNIKNKYNINVFNLKVEETQNLIRVLRSTDNPSALFQPATLQNILQSIEKFGPRTTSFMALLFKEVFYQQNFSKFAKYLAADGTSYFPVNEVELIEMVKIGKNSKLLAPERIKQLDHLWDNWVKLKPTFDHHISHAEPSIPKVLDQRNRPRRIQKLRGNLIVGSILVGLNYLLLTPPQIQKNIYESIFGYNISPEELRNIIQNDPPAYRALLESSPELAKALAQSKDKLIADIDEANESILAFDQYVKSHKI